MSNETAQDGTQRQEIVLETQRRQGLLVEKYIILNEPGIHYRIIDEY